MFIGLVNIPLLITLTGVFLALTACFQSHNNMGLALVCLIFAGIADLFDGLVARRLNSSDREQEFGKQIDSLADAVSFGLTPCILVFHSGFTHWTSCLTMAFFLACALIRLAHFNMTGTESVNGKKYYTGLPVTYAALIFPLIYLIGNLVPGTLPIAIHLTLLLTGLAFIVKAKVPKPSGALYPAFLLAAFFLSFYLLKGGFAHA
jgi:CDP-diacylglycerol--serine O-phosphatidyltransferase